MKSSVASHTMTIDTSRCTATVHHSSPVRTVMPPMTACSTVDAGDQPRVDEHFAAALGAGDGQHRQDRCDDHEEGDQPVAELDGLMDHRHLGVGHRGETSREALRPGSPAPDAVTWTIEPVTEIPAWVSSTARAISRWVRRLGNGAGPPSAGNIVRPSPHDRR